MKKGLEYYPMDVDMFQDIRIRKLIKRQGGKAVTVYTLLLCIIYKEGYYTRWDEELPFIISEQTGFDEAYIREAINCCMTLGLFDDALYKSQKVITSKGIQERYILIRKTMKRVTNIGEFSLISSQKYSEESRKTSEDLGKTSEDLGKTSEESRKTSEKSPIKESKVNKKEKKKPPKGSQKDAAHAAALLEERKEDFYKSLVPYVNKYGKEMVRAFFDYWSEFNKSRTRMRYELEQTWELPKRLATWASRDKQFNEHGTNRPNDSAGQRNVDAARDIASFIQSDAGSRDQPKESDIAELWK